MKPRRLSFLPSLLTLAASAFTVSQAAAADIVWVGSLGAGPSVWNLTTNWTGGTIPNSAADRGDLRKDWTAAPTLNLTAPATVNGILFDDTGAASDVALTLSNNAVAANTLTLAGTTPTLDVTGTMTISAALAGSTAWTKAGTGTLILTNANTGFTGAATISAGVLQMGALTGTGTVATILGSSATIKSGAVIDYTLLHASTTQTGTYSGTTPLILESGGKIRFRATTGSSIYNIASPVTVSGATTIESNGGSYDSDANFTGKFSGSGTLSYLASTASGSATVNRTLKLSSTATDFSGTWFVDYTATTTDDYAELVSGAAGSLGTGSVSLDDRAILTNTVTNGLNSLSGVSILKSTSTLGLGTFPWVNPAATLSLAAGTANIGTGASTIGTLTLTGSSTITGTTGTLAFTTANLNAGTLSGTGILAPVASATINNTAATAATTVSAPISFSASGITVSVSDTTTDANADLIFGGTVSGTSGFSKTGAGTLRFASSGNIAGAVAVTAGKLEFLSSNPTGITGGLSGTGNIDVKGTGIVTLSGPSAGYTGTVTVADGASLGGEATIAGPLVLGATTGAKFWPDVSTPTAAFTATDVTLNGTTPILFATPPAPGTYTILNYTGTLHGSASSLAANYRGASLDVGTGFNSAITLTIGSPIALTWTNLQGNSTWDVGTSWNWYTSSNTPDYFFTSDQVVFDDLVGTSQFVNVAATGVAPASTTISNTFVEYAFGGGAITGAGGLVKDGPGVASLLAANTYTGNTVLKGGGTLRVGATGVFGSGGLSLVAGALTSNGSSSNSVPNAISIDGNVTLGDATNPGMLTLAGNVTLPAARTLTVASPVTVSGILGGTYTLTKDGADALTLTGANTYGNTIVNDGSVQIGAGGTTGVLPASASINGVSTLRYFRSDSPVLANVFSGGGTLAFKGTGTSNQSSYSLTGANTLSGVVAAENGARVQADNSAATRFGTAQIQVLSGGQAYLSAGTFANDFSISGNGWTESSGQLGAIRLNGTITGSVTVAGAARITPYTGTGTIAGSLLGTAPLEIGATTSTSFTGTLNYTGNGTGYTGLVTVSQGGLNLSGALGGDLAVSSSLYAGTLSGEGLVAGGLTLGNGTIGANLIIDPATPGAFTVGGLLTTVNATNVSFTNVPAAGGTFTVLKHGGTTATAANFTATGYRNAPVFDTTTDPTAVTVQITPGNPITWKGPGGSGVWDINTTANWVSPGPVTEKFYTLDAVTFDDTASLFAPTLAVTVSPSSTTFNNSTNAYTLTGAGAIGGTGGLTKSGTNSLTLSTPNTFTGNVGISGGKLVIGNAAALGNGTTAKTVTIASGGQFDFAGISPGTIRNFTYKIAGTGTDGNGAITNSSTTLVGSNSGVFNLELTGDATVGGAGRFDVGGTGTGIITGNGHTLTKVGAGQLELRGDASATPIAIVVQGGILGAEDTDTAFGGATGSVSVASGATVATYGARTIATPVSLAGGSTLSNLGAGAGTWTAPIPLGGDVTVNPGGQTINLNGVVSGTGAITVLPNGGTLNLTAANTFTGGMIIGATNTTATTVNIASGSSLSVASGKLVQLGNTSATGSTATQTLSVSGAVTNAGTLFLGRAGTVTLNSGGTWTQSGNMAVNSQGGYPANLNVSTGSTFTYTGASTVKVNGGSTGLGTITINGLFVTSAGFEVDLVPGGTGYGIVTLAGGTLQLSADIAQLTTANRLTLGTGGGTIDTNGHNASASYAISGAGSALTKAGSGRLTLTGANTYSGPTTVTGGTLAGAGSATSALTLNSGTHLAPGATTGTFNCAGAVLSAGSTLDIEINSSTTTADKVVSTGDVNITGASATFAEIGSGALPGGTKLVILDYTGKTLTGTFNGLAEGATVAAGANSFILSYADSSHITLTSVAGSGYAGWSSTNAGGQAANLDFDGDGVQNGVEYLMGATGSTFTPTPGVVNGKITWPKDPTAAASWLVETSANLSTWTTATGVSDLGTSIQYTVPTGDPKRFVRLRVTVP